jgi:hypothetical protein
MGFIFLFGLWTTATDIPEGQIGCENNYGVINSPEIG